MPKDAGLLLGRACRELGLVWCRWMAGPVNTDIGYGQWCGCGFEFRTRRIQGVKTNVLMLVNLTPKRLAGRGPSSPNLQLEPGWWRWWKTKTALILHR